MFDNLLHQEAARSLKYDIKNNYLPRAILFSGDEGTGKLTAAFETSRILNCKSAEKHFTCTCSSCLQQKALTSNNIMLLGPRDCFLEIASAKEIFLNALKNKETYLDAARYFFIRSLRKLTLRFNDILLKGESNISKIGSIIEKINDSLELIDFPRTLPEYEKVSEICDELVKYSLDLENNFLYDSIPINQIRNLEEWAHVKTEEGKKVIIIENAERMQASVRNALLKILEEPPADCIFILLTSKRNAVMQTILSRVRTYNFVNRNLNQQSNVLKRVFHNEKFTGSINDYLLTFLPISPELIKTQAKFFYDKIAESQIPEIAEIVKQCNQFSPRVILKIFLNELAVRQLKLRNSAEGCEFSAKSMVLLRQCWDNITVYNQSPVSALEILLRDFSVLNKQMQGVMKYSY